MIAVVPVRSGELPSGAAESAAEAGGSAILAGEGTPVAAEALAAELGSSLRAVRLLELGPFGPGRFATALAPFVEGNVVIILPGSPDGRDLAPRLAAVMGRPLLAGALAVTEGGAEVVRLHGSQVATVEVVGPFVATLLPGSRAVHAGWEIAGEPIVPEVLEPSEAAAEVLEPPPPPDGHADPELVELVAADPAAVDLSEAVRIVAGGAGLGGEAAFRLLERVAVQIGASVGGTRVVTDAGYLPHDRQIGTTGLSVAPRCYVALGISGAAQHLGGIRAPEHVISVNLDASCPMMAIADLALVGDAKTFLEALADRLGVATDA